MLAVAGIVAVGTLMVLRADRGEEIRWTVVGTGVDGRSLRIWLPTFDSSCDEVRAEVVEDSAEQLQLEPRLHRRECVIGTAMAGTFETVRLSRSVGGRVIVGRGHDPGARLPSSMTDAAHQESARVLRVPGVLGLRVEDATRLLQRAGYRVRTRWHSRGDHESGKSVAPTARVSYQEPPPETPAAGRWAPGGERVRVVTLRAASAGAD
ncbi:MAG: PASTA domain-containing protein [Solirubrobacteraceae bacterium]|nr:PASTA domain-containing protein [Solirubrobacteraceae bacterium]